jgi:hypothetical protein
MTGVDAVQVSFPWSVVRERVDGEGIVILMPRDRLIELENFLAALRLGLIEADTAAVGSG